MDLDTIMLLYANLIELQTMIDNAARSAENLAKAIEKLILIKADTLEIIKKQINEGSR